MMTKENYARTFATYTEKCPNCGGDLVKVPYFSGVMTAHGTSRVAASLATDKFVTTFSVDFLEEEFGGFCPACTAANVDEANAYIEKENARKTAEYGSLTEKQRNARRCPWSTVVFLVCMALAAVALALTLFKVFDVQAGIPIIICLVIVGGVLGFATMVSNEGGLFPLRYPKSEYELQPLRDKPEFTQEELASLIIKRRGSGDLRQYFTPGAIQSMQR